LYDYLRIDLTTFNDLYELIESCDGWNIHGKFK